MTRVSGFDLARDAGAGLHADVLENFRDQLLIVMLRRLADKTGKVDLPVAEVDATGGFVVWFSVADGLFHFEVRKKQ